MENTSNKAIALALYKYVIGQRKTELIDTYVKEDYIQHNPMGKNGRAALAEMVGFLKTLPQPEVIKSPILRAIEDGDLVALHLDLTFMGKRMVVIDLFRLEDGLLAEHWDAVEEQPEQHGLEITSTNGATDISIALSAEAGKQVVRNFYQQVVQTGAGKLLSTGYVEHDTRVIKSGRPYDEYLKEQPGLEIKLHRVIGEGDFVVAQAEFIYPGKSVAHYDIFRLADGLIAEHWSVEQDVPAVMAHHNGMF